MPGVQSSIATASIVHYLRTHSNMQVGEGEAPSPAGAQSGKTRKAYLRVDEISTWVFMGDDYLGERDSIIDGHWQVTGIGVNAYAAGRARDTAMQLLTSVQGGTGDYLHPLPQVRPNETSNTGYEEDPSPSITMSRRRPGGVLTVQHKTSEFIAPAYLVVTCAVI